MLRKGENVASSKEASDEVLKDSHGFDGFCGLEGDMKRPANAPVKRTAEAELTNGNEEKPVQEKTALGESGIKNPHGKSRGIEDFSLKIFAYTGEYIFRTPSFPPQGAEY
jgi:hypothetical protein